MEISTEPKSVYPMQPFTLILSIKVKELPEPYTGENPVGVQTEPPQLQIPWVDDDSLPEGLVPRIDWQRWLGPLKSDTGAGFAVNNIGSNSVFSFFENRRTTFLPEPHKIGLKDRGGNTAGYWQFQFKRTFIAKRAGKYDFGPVTLKGIFASGADSTGSAKSRDVYAWPNR